jgi:DNA polymerase III delta prime subunit
MILGNEETVRAFRTWIKQWTLKKKPGKACMLVGPPGVGKTTLARAAANDYGFRVVELNASDVRTEKTIKNVLTPVTSSRPLEVFAEGARGNLVLLDEVDGVFGREDRGGLGAILAATKGATLPMVLTANDVDDERFDDLKKACTVLTMQEIRPRLVVTIINAILVAEGRSLDSRVVNRLAGDSRGDLRSVINDAQAMATGNISQIHSHRTKELDAKDTLRRLFSGRGFDVSRRALNETEIPLYRDELLLLIHDLLPYIYTTKDKLAKAYDALSRADIGYGMVGASRSRGMMPAPFNLPRQERPPEWSLLPSALNELASVGSQQPDENINHAMDVAPRISSKIIDRFQYRLWALDHLCGRLAGANHISKRKARLYVVPTLIAIFRLDEARGRDIAAQLDLDERDIEFLVTESKVQPTPSGPEEILDPTAFKLPYMGKDKFIQLMRAGITYDRNSRKFAVRRLDNLDAVEERLTGILSRPVKFARQGQAASAAEDKAIQECYVDGRQVPCEKCEFITACPTHNIASLKFCLCDETMADPKAYEKYVAKNSPLFEPAKEATKGGRPTKRAAAHKKP